MTSSTFGPRISEAKFREIIKYFVFDVGAAKTAKITHLNCNTINKIFDGIRQIICLESMKIAPSNGTFELDEPQVDEVNLILQQSVFEENEAEERRAKHRYLVF